VAAELTWHTKGDIEIRRKAMAISDTLLEAIREIQSYLRFDIELGHIGADDDSEHTKDLEHLLAHMHAVCRLLIQSSPDWPEAKAIEDSLKRLREAVPTADLDAAGATEMMRRPNYVPPSRAWRRPAEAT
jgi:hypothetical protein